MSKTEITLNKILKISMFVAVTSLVLLIIDLFFAVTKQAIDCNGLLCTVGSDHVFFQVTLWLFLVLLIVFVIISRVMLFLLTRESVLEDAKTYKKRVKEEKEKEEFSTSTLYDDIKSNKIGSQPKKVKTKKSSNKSGDGVFSKIKGFFVKIGDSIKGPFASFSDKQNDKKAVKAIEKEASRIAKEEKIAAARKAELANKAEQDLIAAKDREERAIDDLKNEKELSASKKAELARIQKKAAQDAKQAAADLKIEEKRLKKEAAIEEKRLKEEEKQEKLKEKEDLLQAEKENEESIRAQAVIDDEIKSTEEAERLNKIKEEGLKNEKIKKDKLEKDKLEEERLEKEADTKKSLEKEKTVKIVAPKKSSKPVIIKKTKVDVIEYIEATTGISKNKSNKFLKFFAEVVKEELAKGKNVTISEFGTFTTILMPEKEAVNPQTNEKIIVPAHNQVRLRFDDKFKDIF